MRILVLFVILSAINVIFSTIRSISTIKSGKIVASLVNGGYYAFYNIMLIYSVADFPMWQKCVITFACNLIGVYFVKFIEEKARKDKLWRVELSIDNKVAEKLHAELKTFAIPHYFIVNVGKHSVFYCYCATQKESKFVKEIADRFHAKYFVTESKEL